MNAEILQKHVGQLKVGKDAAIDYYKTYVCKIKNECLPQHLPIYIFTHRLFSKYPDVQVSNKF